MPQRPINEIRDQMDAAIAKLKGDSKVIILGCENALNFSSLEADNIQVVSLFCIGMMPATLVEYALVHGAEGVFITGCRTGDCFYRYGNVWMDERFDGERQPILRRRAERSRIKVFRAAITDKRRLHKELAEFQNYLKSLKQDQLSVKKEGSHE